MSFGTVKLSVIFFYKRIFRGQLFEALSNALIAIVIAWTASFFLAILFECGTNYWALWSTLENLLTYCVDDTKIFKAFTISDVITDGLILAMPQYWVCPLDMSQVTNAHIEFRFGNYKCQREEKLQFLEFSF